MPPRVIPLLAVTLLLFPVRLAWPAPNLVAVAVALQLPAYPYLRLVTVTEAEAAAEERDSLHPMF